MTLFLKLLNKAIIAAFLSNYDNVDLKGQKQLKANPSFPATLEGKNVLYDNAGAFM